MGVVRPCSPLHNDIVTPRQLFYQSTQTCFKLIVLLFYCLQNMFGRRIDFELVLVGVDDLIVLLNILVVCSQEFVDERFHVRPEVASFAVKVDEDVAVEKPSRRKRMSRAETILNVAEILRGDGGVLKWSRVKW